MSNEVCIKFENYIIRVKNNIIIDILKYKNTKGMYFIPKLGDNINTNGFITNKCNKIIWQKLTLDSY